jgi:hypothetical protein
LAKDLAEADSAEALTTILDGHPHLHAPGNSVDVLELLAMPGKWEASRGPGYPDRVASGWIPGPSCVRLDPRTVMRPGGERSPPLRQPMALTFSAWGPF